MRPKVAEDISKPLQNSFIHAGHGAPFGKSWGSPAYIDDMYLRNPMEPPDVLGFKHEPVTTPQLSDRRKKTQSLPAQPVIRKPASVQFNYKKLHNESVRLKPPRPSQPPSGKDNNNATNKKQRSSEGIQLEQKEGVLIDLSPEECQKQQFFGNLGNSELTSGESKSKSQVSLLDEPIDIPTEDDFNDGNYIFLAIDIFSCPTFYI